MSWFVYVPGSLASVSKTGALVPSQATSYKEPLSAREHLSWALEGFVAFVRRHSCLGAAARKRARFTSSDGASRSAPGCTGLCWGLTSVICLRNALQLARFVS